MKKIFSLFVAALFCATMVANQYWYRGNDNSWSATAMTVSEDGYYEYIASSNNAHQFKIAASADGWDYNWSFVQAGFNSTNVTNIGDYGSDNCYCWQSGSYYILVYYPNTNINSTTKPIICASTVLPKEETPVVNTVTLYFVNAEDWTDVHTFVYYKEGSNPAVEYKAYPGEAMTKTDMKLKGKDVYSYTFPETYDKIGFVEVGGTHETNNYSWNTLTPYYYEDGDGIANNNWHAITDLYEDVTAYFVNDDDWTVVNAFVWPDAGSAYKAWPGVAMTKTAEQVNGKDIYSYTFPENYVNIIFNNKVGDEGIQTADLKFDVAKPYYSRAQGKWYATKGDIPAVVVPAKFYITGTAVGGWDPAAVKSTEDSYTITSLAADTEYKLKVTVDGTWGTAKGYSDLTVKAAGLSEGDNNNIVFKLASDGDVVVTYTSTVFKLEGDFKAEATALDNAQAGEKAMKMIENGQLVILKNGVRYSVLGVRVK